MRIALDTNRYRDFMDGKPEALEIVRRAEEIILPFAVVAELRGGFLWGSHTRANEERLTSFLSEGRVRVAYVDGATTHHYARIYFQLRRQGTPIPENDMWIAAVVLQHDLSLYTRDTHFECLPQVPRV